MKQLTFGFIYILDVWLQEVNKKNSCGAAFHCFLMIFWSFVDVDRPLECGFYVLDGMYLK